MRMRGVQRTRLRFCEGVRCLLEGKYGRERVQDPMIVSSRVGTFLDYLGIYL